MKCYSPPHNRWPGEGVHRMHAPTRQFLKSLIVVLGSFAFASLAIGQANLGVATDAGPIHGKQSADGKVRNFLGIPFAAPPVGNLRWMPPQPVAPWKEVRE